MTVTTAEQSVETPLPVEARAGERRAAEHAWVWQVTTLSVVLGMMLALAISTTYRIRNSGEWRGMGISDAVLRAYKERDDRARQENLGLQKLVEQYKASVNSNSAAAELARKETETLRAWAGLTPVVGPGLRITLRDSPENRLSGLPPEEYANFLVHDKDLNGLISELKAAGAEALAISGADARDPQRIVVTSTARCVGPTAIVNGVSLAAPYTILAVGNPKELRGALEIPGGFIQMGALDALKMIEIKESQRIVIPKYSGAVTLRHARPSPESP